MGLLALLWLLVLRRELILAMAQASLQPWPLRLLPPSLMKSDFLTVVHLTTTSCLQPFVITVIPGCQALSTIEISTSPMR